MAKTQQRWTRTAPAAPAAPSPEMLAAMFSRPSASAPTVPAKPPLIPAMPWEAIRHRVRLALRPWYFIGGVGVAGLVAHTAAVPAAYLVPAGLLGSAAIWVAARRKTRGKPETSARRARAALYTALTAAGWITAAAEAGNLHSVSAALVTSALVPAGAIAAAPYWRYVRNQPVALAPGLAPVSDVEQTVLRVWRTRLAYRRGDVVGQDEIGEQVKAVADGKAAGSTLSNWRRIEGGWSARIAVAEGSGFDFTATALRRAVAQAYRVGEGAVNIAVDSTDASTAELMVQPKSQLAEVQVWPGPSAINISEGNITMTTGRYFDGTPLLRRAYSQDWGSPSRVVLGTTGGGKTEDIKQQLTAERWTAAEAEDGTMHGLFISILHDSGIKQGRDYADMLDGLHGFGHTREEAHLIIDALLREGARRYEMTRDIEWVDDRGRVRKGVSNWNPFVHGPLISVVFDEFHEQTEDPTFVKKLEKLARLQRGCCIPVTLATQMATIGDTGSQALRDMLASGSASLFRTTSALNKALTTGTGLATVDPRELEPIPGMCFVANGGSPPIKARTSYIPSSDLYDWWHDQDNNLIGYPATIPPETLEAFGSEWADWQRARAAGVKWKPKPTTAAEPKPVKEGTEAAVLAVLRSARGPVQFNRIVDESNKGTSSCTAALRKLSSGDAPVVRSVEGQRGFWELADPNA